MNTVASSADYDVTGDLSGVYLKKSDVEDKSLSLSIASVDRVVFEARNGKGAESKWVLTFAGDPVRKMTLNKTNLTLLARAFSKRTGAWLGQTVDVVLDDTVSFGGQLVGGLRIRCRKPVRRPVPVAQDPDDALPSV